jgi:ribosomal protein S10
VRNLEFFADFAIRAAYYLKLPVSGPVPLPKITERWTFIRSNFVHKKSKENFERITSRRLIQIKDGNPQAVQAWLAFLRKHAFYGVGMKANVWEHESLGSVPLLANTIPSANKLQIQISRRIWTRPFLQSKRTSNLTYHDLVVNKLKHLLLRSHYPNFWETSAYH